MVTHKLVPYTIRVYEKHGPGNKIAEDEYFDLDSLNVSMPSHTGHTTFVSFLENLFHEISIDPYIDSDFGRTLTALAWESHEEKGEIEAVLGKGKYGEPGDHLDLDELDERGKTATDVREMNALGKDTSLERRYHLLYKRLDTNPRKGLLILQARSQGGVKSDLRGKITNNLEEIDKSVTSRMDTIVGGDLYKKLTENPITGFEVLETQVDSDDYIKNSDDFGSPPKKQRVTVNLSADGDGFFNISKNKIRKMVNNKEVPLAEFLPSGNDRGTTSHKVEIEKNGRNRKVNISSAQPKMEQDITSDIKRTADGRPDMVSVASESRRLASEIIDEHGWGTIETETTLIEKVSLKLNV